MSRNRSAKGQVMPKLSPPQKVPKVVSMMPTTNFKLFSGMRLRGACTRAPTAITSTPAPSAPRAALPMPPAPLPPKEMTMKATSSPSASTAAAPSAPRIALRQVVVMLATSTSVNASTNSTAEARKAAITIAHCIGVFLLLKTRPDREQRRAIPRRSHHEGRVFWWSWNHFLLIDGVLSALKWLDIVAPFGSRLGRAQRSTCVLRLRAAYVILGLHGHIPLVSAVRKYRRGGARKSVRSEERRVGKG